MKERQITTVHDFGVRLLEELEEEGKYCTAHVYRAMFNRLEGYVGRELTFRELTPGFLKRFEQVLFGQSCKHNTVSLYLRLLRAAYNRATRAGCAGRMPAGLFSGVFTGTDKAEKRSVSLSALSRLFRADLQAQPRLDDARNLFLLSFYMRGIPFVDLIGLRKSDVSNNRIHYRRSKTGSPLAVDIEPCIRELLQRYAAQTAGESPYLLPVLTAGGGRRGYGQYQSALRKYNRQLAQLSELLNLRVCLSSYVARHSWATLAYQDHVPVAKISESLGHASEKITYHYLAGFDDRALRKVNRRLIALVQQDECKERLTKKRDVKTEKQPEIALKREDFEALKGSLERLYERLRPMPLLYR